MIVLKRIKWWFVIAFHQILNFFFVKIECGLYLLDCFDVLMSKMIFKKWKNIIGMYFDTKSYLKSNRYHTAKHRFFYILIFFVIVMGLHSTEVLTFYLSFLFSWLDKGTENNRNILTSEREVEGKIQGMCRYNIKLLVAMLPTYHSKYYLIIRIFFCIIPIVTIFMSHSQRLIASPMGSFSCYIKILYSCN
jgi:hypothetical protein